MRKIGILLTLVLTTTVVSTFELNAQEINITGKVVNSNGFPVSQAQVSLLLAEISAVTDAAGNFTLYRDNTGIEDFTAIRNKSRFDGKRLYLNCNYEQVRISIIDISGREIASVLSMQSLSGKYMIYPGAYIDYRHQSVLIIQVLVGKEMRAFKFVPGKQSTEDKGLFEVSDMGNSKKSSSLKEYSTVDTLVISHSSFTGKKIPIDCNICSFGDITLFEVSPIAPDNLTGSSPSSSSVMLHWNDNSNNETGFRIEKASWQVMEWSVFNELTELSPNLTEYTDNGLIQGQSYKYRICAFNDGGNSPFTDEVVVTTQVSNPISNIGPGYLYWQF